MASSWITRRQWLVLAAAVSGILLVGFLLRLHDLEKSTIGHIEMYVPGLELPDELSDPRPRLTVVQTLVGVVTDGEPHPPGYYLFMFGWTRLFGTSVLS